MSPTTTTTTGDYALFKASFSSASSLMALQFFSRIFTFILNQAMLRMAPPSAYGTAAIQFELMLSTILFLSREGVRNTLLRVPRTDASTKNLSILPVALGVPLSLVSSFLYVRFAGNETKKQEYFTASTSLYALAAVVELSSEPFHNRAMSELQTTIRVTAEGLGVIFKAVVTFLVLLYDTQTGRDGALALLAFAAGQLVYGITVLSSYMTYYPLRSFLSKHPGKGHRQQPQYVDPTLLRLSLTMTFQSLVKHLLTEGDKLILSWFSPLQDQGGYAVAVNYGSLIARIVFQPIEETSRLFFSRTLTGGSSNDAASLQQAATALLSLLSIQAAFSVVLLVFGTSYVPIALHILLPRQYLATSAPRVLAAWIWYVPVLAINGGLEAFLSSVANSQDLNRQSRWMGIFSVIYITTALTLFKFKLGDASLVYANIVNLAARILYSINFVSFFYERKHARHMLQWGIVRPRWPFIMSVAVSAVGIRLSQNRIGVTDALKTQGKISLWNIPILLHIGVGGSMAVLCLGVWWISSGCRLNLPRSKTH